VRRLGAALAAWWRRDWPGPDREEEARRALASWGFHWTFTEKRH
jgi:hypothetical protein